MEKKMQKRDEKTKKTLKKFESTMTELNSIVSEKVLQVEATQKVVNIDIQAQLDLMRKDVDKLKSAAPAAAQAWASQPRGTGAQAQALDPASAPGLGAAPQGPPPPPAGVLPGLQPPCLAGVLPGLRPPATEVQMQPNPETTDLSRYNKCRLLQVPCQPLLSPYLRGGHSLALKSRRRRISSRS